MPWFVSLLLLLVALWVAVACLVEVLAWRACVRQRRPAPPCFRDPPRRDASAPDARVCFLGDLQRGVADVARPLARLLREDPPDLLVSSGDLVGHGEGPYYGVLLRAFEEAGVATPLRVVPGNHDLFPRGSRESAGGYALFRRHFGEPEWHLRVGPLLLVGLDDVGGPVPAARAREIGRLAREHSGPWILVCHRPPRDLEKEDAPVADDLLDLVRVLEERPPLLVVSGHAHHFGDREVNGVRYVVNAHGGDVHGLALRRPPFELLRVRVGPGDVFEVRRSQHARRASLEVWIDQLAVRCWWSRRTPGGAFLTAPIAWALRVAEVRAPLG